MRMSVRVYSHAYIHAYIRGMCLRMDVCLYGERMCASVKYSIVFLI